MSNELPMGEEEAPRKRGIGRRILIILILLLTIVAGLAGVWFFILDSELPKFGSDSAEPDSTISSSVGAGSDAPKVLGNTVPLETFIVNLADPLGRRVLNINISLEVADASAISEIKRNDPRIRDAIIILLSSKSYADISSADSKMILKSEITSRVNQLLGDHKVSHTFITNMLVR